jgi:very-short-patch-repair endonuclease
LTWPDAVVAFGSAAAVHRLPVRTPDAVHVIVPRRLPHRAGLVTHELRLAPEDVVRCGAGLVTSLRRTLFDCIGRLPSRESERLVAWAATRTLLSPRALADDVASRPRSWGNTARRTAVEDMAEGRLSAAERRLHRILQSAGITGWSADVQVRDDDGLIGRADVLFAEERLVVEVDGFEHHAVDEFQRDRTRQNRLVLAGWTVLRFTWSDLVDRPGMVADRIRTMLTTLGRR